MGSGLGGLGRGKAQMWLGRRALQVATLVTIEQTIVDKQQHYKTWNSKLYLYFTIKN